MLGSLQPLPPVRFGLSVSFLGPYLILSGKVSKSSLLFRCLARPFCSRGQTLEPMVTRECPSVAY